jgi:hypothetical protein
VFIVDYIHHNEGLLDWLLELIFELEDDLVRPVHLDESQTLDHLGARDLPAERELSVEHFVKSCTVNHFDILELPVNVEEAVLDVGGERTMEVSDDIFEVLGQFTSSFDDARSLDEVGRVCLRFWCNIDSRCEVFLHEGGRFLISFSQANTVAGKSEPIELVSSGRHGESLSCLEEVITDA